MNCFLASLVSSPLFMQSREWQYFMQCLLAVPVIWAWHDFWVLASKCAIDFWIPPIYWFAHAQYLRVILSLKIWQIHSLCWIMLIDSHQHSGGSQLLLKVRYRIRCRISWFIFDPFALRIYGALFIDRSDKGFPSTSLAIVELGRYRSLKAHVSRMHFDACTFVVDTRWSKRQANVVATYYPSVWLARHFIA